VPVAPAAPVVETVLVVALVVALEPAPVVAAVVDAGSPPADGSLLEQLATMRHERSPTRYGGNRHVMVFSKTFDVSRLAQQTTCGPPRGD
jgi:hypothetical protein